MLTRFFIDRPIFATVLSIAITLAGAIALFTLPVAQYPQITPPGVQVSIQYPGASTRVVADTVAAPIEQQVNGIDHMLYMSSQSGNDGSYSLTVTFEIGTDTNTALVMVQNRVALAMFQLPTSVQNQGILIRKKTPDILMVVNFYSPHGLHNDVYLSNYATINVKDELLRVAGVSDITYLGQRDYSIRAWLDLQKLASLSMTANDVANAVRSQNLDAPAGQVGQPPAAGTQSWQLPIDTLGRLTTPEQFGDIIIRTAPGQQPPQAGVTSPSGSGGYGLPTPPGANPPPQAGVTSPSGSGGYGLPTPPGANPLLPARKYDVARRREQHGIDGRHRRRHWFQRGNFRFGERQQCNRRSGWERRRRLDGRRRDVFRQFHGRHGEQPRAYQLDRRREQHRPTRGRHDRADRADRADRQHRASAQRGPRRTGRSELHPGLHLRSASFRGPGRLATARHECAGRCQPR